MTQPTDNSAALDPRHDPRSVDELIGVILSAPDDDLAWDAVTALHWRGSAEVLARASELCRSGCAVERRVGANLLGQLGAPERTYPEACFHVLVTLLEHEQDHRVQEAALVALSFLHRVDSIALAARFLNHPDSGVRFGVVYAVMGHDDPRAVAVLITLMNDPEAQVRDWATFGLGTQIALDTPVIRAALFARLDDDDEQTRAEALVGLARRRDPRVVPALGRELASESVGRSVVEAAGLIGDPSLLPELLALREWWDVDVAALEEAIACCTPGENRIADAI